MDIKEKLKLRPGMPDDALLKDLIEDCSQDLKDLLHTDILTEADDSILKELVLIRVNYNRVEGIASESFGGVSTSYLDDLPKSLRRKINARRRLPR